MNWEIGILMLVAIAVVTGLVVAVIQRRKSENVATPGRELDIPRDSDHLPAPFAGFKIAPIDVNAIRNSTPVGVGNVTLAGLSTLVQPGLFTNLVTASTRCVQLVFSPETTAAIANGTARSMSEGSAIAVSSATGRTMEHGRLGAASALSNAAGLAAAWHVASFAVGQAHLMDISQRLEAIDGRLQVIEYMLKEDKLGRLYGNLATLRKRESLILKGLMSDVDLVPTITELDEIDRELEQLLSQWEIELARLSERSTGLKLDGWFDSNTDVGKITEQIEKLKWLVDAMRLAESIQVASCGVRCSIPGAIAAKSHRIDVLRDGLDARVAWRAANRAISELIGKLDSSWASSAALNERRTTLSEKLKTVEAAREESTKGLKDLMAQLQSRLTGPDQSSLSLVLRLNESREVVSVERLLN